MLEAGDRRLEARQIVRTLTIAEAGKGPWRYQKGRFWPNSRAGGDSTYGPNGI